MRCLAAAGIRQFLDIGSGIPTQGNVHEVAQQAAPGARVVYTDVDPVAIAHSKALLDGNPDAEIINADLREPEKILAHPTTRELIDFSQPTGLLLAMVLHFISDAEDPWAIVATLRDALAPGSFIVLSHVENEGRPEKAQAAEKVYNRSVATSVQTALAGRNSAFLRRIRVAGSRPGLHPAVAARLPGRRTGRPEQVLGPGRRGAQGTGQLTSRWRHGMGVMPRPAQPDCVHRKLARQ